MEPVQSPVLFQASGEVEEFRVVGDREQPLGAHCTLRCASPVLPGGIVRYRTMIMAVRQLPELVSLDGRGGLVGRVATMTGVPVPSKTAGEHWVEVIRGHLKIHPKS